MAAINFAFCTKNVVGFCRVRQNLKNRRQNTIHRGHHFEKPQNIVKKYKKKY